MKLTILGCGTVSWQADRACSCYHVAAGDTRLIMDCGSGAMKRFEDAGIDYFDLDAVLLSHTQHPDHVTDFCMLLFSLNYSTSGAALRERRNPMQVVGPTGTRELVDHLSTIHPAMVPLHYELQVRECTDEAATLGDVRVVAAMVSHGDTPALGFRLEHEGRVLAFSGDTGPCAAVVELFRHADLGIMECSVEADVVNLSNHLDARQVGELATRAEVQRLLLTHQYPGVRRSVVESQVRENYDGPLLVAQDLDVYEI